MNDSNSVHAYFISGHSTQPHGNLSQSPLFQNLERYFDHAATTPLEPAALEAMLPFLTSEFGNPNSPHAYGQRARDAVEQSRAILAAALSTEEFEVDPEQLIFTSGATEGNNWVLSSFKSVSISPFEHSSVLETAKALGHSILPNEGHKILPPPQANDLIPPGLISVMTVNNETGAWYSPVDPSLAQSPGFLTALRHSDITQAAFKYPVDLGQLDYATFSGHKFNGPKGVGVLYTKTGELPPMMHGGEHERGYRAGTLNVPAIVGMAVAAQKAQQNQESHRTHITNLRNAFLSALDRNEDVQSFSPPDGAPHILSFSFRGLEGESLVIEADAAGFAISSGAACSTQSNEPSHVLTALGVDPEFIRGTVRISFGTGNTEESAVELAKTLNRVAQTLQHLKK